MTKNGSVRAALQEAGFRCCGCGCGGDPDREREGEIGGVAKKWIRIDNDFPRLFALLCLLTLKSS